MVAILPERAGRFSYPCLNGNIVRAGAASAIGMTTALPVVMPM
ncbi:hypothetical protein GJA_4499 [Janthinobacterium agaricidamnosum NBRC 102515 = DSM 9628]|uniref:Uncharacterized protein n=1 Tax=Janthinobacterium agaricidamnosum NBRC 102515 = DSM 9628 TaxID=1349767 RepID=W0VB51_9BURK|nr:hypothetical protein GJA_4499 [Janthinobacterium agaricidamnosum NBRC 102515 = DSM 9628]